jgi:cellulose synthase/poly-beta-1,6-N-acetylglucosamine synthase-like glycosyltransferase
MMIPILTDYYQAGYLPKPRYGTLPSFVPNANLAVRRQAIEQIGRYDEACRAGEDADLCLRAARAGWDIFYERRAVVRHEPKHSLLALIGQWWWYGSAGGRVFEKAMSRRCEVYLSPDARPRIHRYVRLLSTNFCPLRVLVFISPFLLFHLGMLLAAALLALGHRWPALALVLAMAPVALILHRRSSLRALGLRELFLYGTLTWVLNWTCILGSIAGGLRRRMLFVFPGL